MAKNDIALWDQAKAFFEIGKSLTYISDTLGIEKSTISKRAKREGWEKGKFQQLCDDSVRISTEISTLNSTVKAVVENEIAERTKALQFFANVTHKNLSMVAQKINKESSLQDHLTAQITYQKGRETWLGKELPAAAIVNNQTIIPPAESSKDWIEGKFKKINGTTN